MNKHVNENAISDAIKQIQQTLKNSGKNIKVDGVFGPETAAAVLSNSKFKNKSNNVSSKEYYEKTTKSAEFDTLFQICQNLYDVLDGNPEKYFKTFKGLLNDRESDAQAWFESAWKKAWGSTMDKLLKSTNLIIRKNAQNVNYAVKQFIKYIGEQHIGAAALTHTIVLTHPIDKEQSETWKIRFDYM